MENTLSVIIPNYNNGKYLEKCIGSILSQTLIPNEIIIVDDCSTDNSRDIIKKFKETNSICKGVFLNKNNGVSNARYVGVKNAASEYITFIDSDDYYFNDRKLELEMELIKLYKEKYNEDIISYSKTVNVDMHGKPMDNENGYYYFEGNILFKLLSDVKAGFLPRDYCYLKKIYTETGGYNFNMNLYEDLDFLIRISANYKFYSTKKEGTAYRITNNGLSSRTLTEHINTKYNIYLNNKKLLSNYKQILCIILRYLINIRRKIKLCLFKERIQI